MSKEAEDIPDDIMKTASAGAELFNDWLLGDNAQGELSPYAVSGLADTIAKLLNSERKKWDGASTFDRCMEK